MKYKFYIPVLCIIFFYTALFGYHNNGVLFQQKNENLRSLQITSITDGDDSLTYDEKKAVLNFYEDSEPQESNLNRIFSGPGNISYTIISNSDPELIDPEIRDSILTVYLVPEVSGNSELIIEATSNGQSIQGKITAIVFAVDDPPVVQNKIEDIYVEQGDEPEIIDLFGVFYDPDNDDYEIHKVIGHNTNSILVIPTINNNRLTLTFVDGEYGEAEITLSGNSNGKEISFKFHVYVSKESSINIQDKQNKYNIVSYSKNNKLYISQSGGIFGNATVELLNIQGQIIYKQTDITITKSPLMLSTPHLMQGIYILKSTVDGNDSYNKILIH